MSGSSWNLQHLTIDAFGERQQWASAIAERLLQHINSCQRLGRPVKIALPGGQTPDLFLAKLNKLTWPDFDVEIIPTDERAVEIGHPRRNDGMIQNALAGQAKVRFISLLKQPGSPQRMLRSLQKKLDSATMPLSLAVLGMGTDGHIASIFPLKETAARGGDIAGDCLWMQRRGEDYIRLSLGWNSLMTAESVWLVILGQEKMDCLQSWLSGADLSLPVIQLLRSRSVTLLWSP